MICSRKLKSISYAKMRVKILPARASGARGTLQLAEALPKAGMPGRQRGCRLAGFAAVPCGQYAGQSGYAGVEAEIPCAASKIFELSRTIRDDSTSSKDSILTPGKPFV